MGGCAERGPGDGGVGNHLDLALFRISIVGIIPEATTQSVVKIKGCISSGAVPTAELVRGGVVP